MEWWMWAITGYAIAVTLLIARLIPHISMLYMHLEKSMPPMAKSGLPPEQVLVSADSPSHYSH